MATAHPYDAKRSRPGMGAEYGLTDTPDTMLTWAWVSRQMEQARNYWVSTTRPNGDPHVAPVWGVWANDKLYFSTGQTSVKAKNLQHNPRVALHLESGDEVVIMEGAAVTVDDRDALLPIGEAYAAKYPSMGTAEKVLEFTSGKMWVITPERVLAWLENDFVGTATRWMP